MLLYVLYVIICFYILLKVINIICFYMLLYTITNYKLALHLSDEDPEPDSYIGLLDAIRNCEFLKSCLDIVSFLNFDVAVDI